MSLLPQQRKSSEEIEKLRETLGIVAPPTDAAVEATLAVAEPAVRSTPVPEIFAPAPVPREEISPPRQPRAEQRVPVLPVEENGPPPQHSNLPEPLDLAPATFLQPTPGQKGVRSLRKSEQGPLPPVSAVAPDSKLPVHRHNDQELNDLRRHAALATLAPWTHPQSLTANLALVIPGYLFAIGAAAWFYYGDIERQEMRISAGCVIVALLVAAFIFFRKPLSRHHAAFIGVIALFDIIFGALYYFPQLRHGT